MPTTLTDQLCALAREAGASGVPVVLADRPDGTVVGLGGIVAKAHPPSTSADAESGAEARELAARLQIAAHPRLAGILLPPLGAVGTPGPATVDLLPLRMDGGRVATLWPRGTAVATDAPDAAPWEAAGTLLARLHSVPTGNLTDATTAARPGPIPPMRGPAKAARALARMREALGPGGIPRPDCSSTVISPALAGAAEAVEGAWSTLPSWCRAEVPPPDSRTGTLCHGDFHLGQLVRHPAPGGPWQLIDIDDLGLGDPAWDLARPAAWYAAGLLSADCWNSFLRAYQTGAAIPADDPWHRLDAPARALTTQTAALAVAKAHAAQRPLDEAESACVEACARIADHEPARTTATSSAVTGPPYEAGA